MEAPSDGYLTGPSPPLTTVASTLGWLLFLVLCAVIGVAVVRLRKAVPPVQDRGSLDDPDDLDRLGLSAARPATARPEPEGEPARVRPSDPILPPARSRPAVEAPRPGGVRLSDDAPWLAEILSGGLARDRVGEARERLARLGVLDAAAEAVDRYTAEGEAALDAPPAGPAADALRQLALGLASRRR